MAVVELRGGHPWWAWLASHSQGPAHLEQQPLHPPIPGNKLGTERKDQETHCVRHVFVEYSTAVKAQRLLLPTGGSRCRDNKQAAQTRRPKGEAPPHPQPCSLPWLQTFLLLPGCRLLVHPALVDVPLLLSSTRPVPSLSSGQGCSLTLALVIPPMAPGGCMPPPPLGCFVLQAPWGPPSTYTMERCLKISQHLPKDKDFKSFQEGKNRKLTFKKKKSHQALKTATPGVRRKEAMPSNSEGCELPPGILSHQGETETYPQTWVQKYVSPSPAEEPLKGRTVALIEGVRQDPGCRK